jgi:hypothetical protein
MKKLLVLFLSFILLLTSFTPSVSAAAQDGSVSVPDGIPTANYTYTDLKKLQSEPDFYYNFLPASPKWLEFVGDEQPATFLQDNIICELADNVIRVNKTITDSIADMGQILSGSNVQKLTPNRIIENGGYIS